MAGTLAEALSQRIEALITRELNDLAKNLWSADDFRLEDEILGASGDYQTFNFRRQGSGSPVFVYDSEVSIPSAYKSGPLSLWVESGNASFIAGDAGSTYSFFAGTHLAPAHVRITGGSIAGDTLAVTGFPVSFAHVMQTILMRLAVKHAKEPTVKGTGIGYEVANIPAQLRKVAEDYYPFAALGV